MKIWVIFGGDLVQWFRSGWLPLKQETCSTAPHKNNRNKQDRPHARTATPTRPGASGPERIFASFLELFLVTFPGFAKNAAPHELTVNTNQIEGRAPVKTSQKASKNEEKNGMKTNTNK